MSDFTGSPLFDSSMFAEPTTFAADIIADAIQSGQWCDHPAVLEAVRAVHAEMRPGIGDRVDGWAIARAVRFADFIEIEGLRAERDALRARVETLEADAKRLDWLQSHGNFTNYLDGGAARFSANFSGERTYSLASDLRSAIDGQEPRA